MLEDINELRTFVRIVTAGSLSAAGREMGVALSVVSKRLATLERRTDMRLISRSTRSLALTEEGEALYARALRILAEVDEAETALTHGRIEPQGVLRVSAPVALGRAHIGPICAQLSQAYPKLAIDLTLTDRLVELIDEGMDVVVRIGAPKDSALIVRKLADNRRIVVASPTYLQRRGTPATLAELAAHDCLHYPGSGTLWRLCNANGEVEEVETRARLKSDNGDVAQDWAVAGSGIILKSWVDVALDIRAGRLVHVLEVWRSEPAPVCALFPSNRHLSTRVRLFVDAAAARLTEAVRT
jgi:DNA-binding transcriptional LysR family regulator